MIVYIFDYYSYGKKTRGSIREDSRSPQRDILARRGRLGSSRLLVLIRYSDFRGFSREDPMGSFDLALAFLDPQRLSKS